MQNNKLYTVEITADGSPTLRFKALPEAVDSESMHHSAGAASETVYIYGETFKEAQKLLQIEGSLRTMNCLVVGLGLGYIEMLIALESQFTFNRLISFEKDEHLIKSFKNWLNDDSTESIYSEVFKSLKKALHRDMDEKTFKQNFRQSLKEGRVVFYPELNKADKTDVYRYNVICYDAFSKKTNEDLWNFEFLDSFIENYSADFCVFATYAKTGDLTRALKKQGFELKERKGFSNKRDCTLASRMS